jgi:uncharacterized protein (TIGR02147 family)
MISFEEKISVFQYTNYRKFLKDKFDEKKRENPRYSHRIFSKSAGLKSSNFLNLIIKGQRNLTRETILRFTSALRLPEKDAQYFEYLVLFNQGKTLKDKDAYFKKAMEVARRVKTLQRSKLIHEDQYEFYSKWYNTCIWALIDMYVFAGDFKWLAQQVHPPVTVKQARESVALLEKINLVKKMDSGVYKVQHNTISTGDSVKSLALSQFYVDTLKLAAQTVEELPKDKRNITGVTMGLSRKTYDAIVEKINALRQEIIDLANADTKSEVVYQLTMPLIPISKPKHGNNSHR